MWKARRLGQLTDGLRRRISYLRISLTDRCNYRCTYCMPEAGIDLAARDQMCCPSRRSRRAVAALKLVGVARVRLTGGEPTVRKDLVELTGAAWAAGTR
jgi:cyclic pyranopterin phosphate synthase